MGLIHGNNIGGGGGGAGADEKAKVSSNDTTAGYLNGKLVAGTNITFTENNDGGDETLTIAAGGGGASQLSDLSDVGVTTPTDKNVLVADGDSWESRALTEADISDFGSYLESETDPVVGAVNGIVKANGAGVISAATENTDYQGVPSEGAFADGDKTKLDGIEANADYSQDTFDLMKDPTGFPNRTDSTISFDDGTRTFTIAPVGASFSIYVNGEETKFTTAKTVTITDTEGLWFIYFNNGTLTASQTPWTFDGGTVFVALVYWDATNNSAIGIGDERHGFMPHTVHEYFHNNFGAVYTSGMTPSVTVDEDGSLDAHCQIASISAGVMYDEDIKFTHPEQTTYEMWYKTGADGYWRKEDVSSAAVAITGTRPDYNEFTGGAWQRTEVDNNKYTLTHIFATNDINKPYILVMGETEYNSKSDAQAGAKTEVVNIVTGSLPIAEFVSVGTVIVSVKDSYTNSYNAILVSTDEGLDFVDFRTSEKTEVGAPVSDHGNLTGLGDDDHTQYALSCTNQFAVTDYTFDGTEVRNGGYAVNTSTGNKTINIDADLFSTGFEVSICKFTADANTVTVDAQAGNTIDGAQTYVLTKAYETITLIKDGSNKWVIKASHIGKPSDFATPSGSETLTNKTIDGDSNTISNLDIGKEVDWAAADDVSNASAFESGDKVLIYEAGVGMRKVDYDDLPSGGSGATQLSELSDVGVTTPTDKNVLVADGDSWESRALVEADISDFGSYLESETDPVVGAVNGIVKANGAGVISAATENTDYQGVPSEGAFADGDKSKLDGIETGADVTDETNVKAALDGATITNATIAAADKVLFQDANDSDKLKQDDAQALADLAQPEGTAIKSTGEIVNTKFLRTDGDGTCSWATIPLPDLSSVVAKSTFDANTILKADTDNTPEALTVGEQTLVGRITGGEITALSTTQVRTLINVEDGADVTDATNVAAAGAVMESDTSTASMSFVIDEDNMASNSATKVPTQQSVKAYVDANAGGGSTSSVAGYLSGSQTISTATNTKIKYDTEDYDTDGEFDNSTNYRFTATDAGIYSVVFSAKMLSVTEGKIVVAQLYKNGTNIESQEVPGSPWPQHTTVVFNSDVKLAANDYIEFYIYHNQGSDITLWGNQQATRFAVTRIQ